MVFWSRLLSDCPSRVSFQTFLENVESLLHFFNLKYVSYTCMILSFARSLVE